MMISFSNGTNFFGAIFSLTASFLDTKFVKCLLKVQIGKNEDPT